MFSSLFARSQVNRTGIVPFPAVFYSRETGLGGALSFVFFDYGDDPLPPSHPDTISAVVFYTEENQFVSVLKYKNYFPRDRYLWAFQTGYSDFPRKYYGIGPDTEKSDAEIYKPRKYSGETSLQRAFASHVYAGILYRYTKIEIDEYDQGGTLQYSDLPGVYGGSVSGTGIRIDLDTRNNSFSPAKGLLIGFDYLYNSDLTGSDFKFQEYTLDSRLYFTLPWHDILATQLYIQINTGEVPFELLPEMGGENLMRGVYRGRYRDKTYCAAQIEYRFIIGSRWSLVAFAGAGQVGPTLNEYTGDGIHLAGGGGVRYYVSRGRRIAYRFDVGFSRDDSGIYVNLMEAF